MLYKIDELFSLFDLEGPLEVNFKDLSIRKRDWNKETPIHATCTLGFSNKEVILSVDGKDIRDCFEQMLIQTFTLNQPLVIPKDADNRVM
jgi:hypothetical protein